MRILILLLGFIQPTFAGTQKTSNLCKIVLAELKESQNCYHPGWCSDNIYFLVAGLVAKLTPEERERAKVILVYAGQKVSSQTSPEGFINSDADFFSIEMRTSLLPLRAREDKPKKWLFHTILMVDDRIYDFDFSRKPFAVPVLHYFSKMLGAGFVQKNGDYVYRETLSKFAQGPDGPVEDESLILYLKAVPIQEYAEDYRPRIPVEESVGSLKPGDWLVSPDLAEAQTVEGFLRPFLKKRGHSP